MRSGQKGTRLRAGRSEQGQGVCVPQLLDCFPWRLCKVV